MDKGEIKPSVTLYWHIPYLKRRSRTDEIMRREGRFICTLL